MAAVSDRCHGEPDVSSLPQGWHPMNDVGANAKASPPVARNSAGSTPPRALANGPSKSSSETTQNGRDARGRTPNSSATARVTTDKLRQEASTEKLRQEAAALQKKVAQFRVENQSLKTKVKRLEEECLRKTRQVDKLTLLSKEKSAVAQDKKKEDDVLKQKCMKLEVQLREKDDKLRKLQSSQKSQLETTDKPQPARNRLSSNSVGGTSAELIRLREQMDRLSQDNRRLALQLKEKDQEIRRLKSQANPQPITARAATASRSQRPASSSRAGCTNEAKRVTTAKRSDTFSVSRSQMAALSNGSPALSPSGAKQTDVVKKRKEELSTTSTSSAPREKSRGTKQRSNPKPPEADPRVERIKRNVAAKKIQRGWRGYQKRKASDASVVSLGSLANGSPSTLKRRTSTGSAAQSEE